MKIILVAGLNFVTGVACGAAAYASKADPALVICLIFGISAASSAFILASEKE